MRFLTNALIAAIVMASCSSAFADLTPLLVRPSLERFQSGGPGTNKSDTVAPLDTSSVEVTNNTDIPDIMVDPIVYLEITDIPLVYSMTSYRVKIGKVGTNIEVPTTRGIAPDTDEIDIRLRNVFSMEQREPRCDGSEMALGNINASFQEGLTALLADEKTSFVFNNVTKPENSNFWQGDLFINGVNIRDLPVYTENDLTSFAENERDMSNPLCAQAPAYTDFSNAAWSYLSVRYPMLIDSILSQPSSGNNETRSAYGYFGMYIENLTVNAQGDGACEAFSDDSLEKSYQESGGSPEQAYVYITNMVVNCKEPDSEANDTAMVPMTPAKKVDTAPMQDLVPAEEVPETVDAESSEEVPDAVEAESSDENPDNG